MKEKIRDPKSEIRNHNGFTLAELAIVLVIVGLLIGMGAGMIGPLTKRLKYNETRSTVKEVYEAINGYAAANKKLPANLLALSTKTMDTYKSNLLYYFAGGLTASDLCTTQGAYLTVNDMGTPRSNVAFVVFSQGENLCNQTDPSGTGASFTIVDTGVTISCSQDPNAGYDDIVMYQDINTLRQQICNSFRIVTDSFPSGTEEIVYPPSVLTATDGSTPYQSWNITGSLPSGLSLQTSGTCGSTACTILNPCICGTPTLDGSYNFDVTVTDAENRTATKSFSITINPNDPRITTEFLTYGTVNTAYPSVTLSATGGNISSPYTWALTSGSLPAGLSLNAGTGVISGTPTAEGTYSFTVTVTDSSSRTASKTLSIAINPESTGSGGGGGGGGSGSAPTCSVTASPDVILSGQTTTLNFSISSGPAYAIFSPQNGTCTTFSSSTGNSCTTSARSSTSTFVLSVSNSNGSSSCSTTVFIGQANYRVWNNTGARYDFNVDGSCRRINNGAEITTGALRLNSGENISRYSTNNGTCGGGVQAQLSYNSAVYNDNDNDGQVNFTGTDR